MAKRAAKKKSARRPARSRELRVPGRLESEAIAIALFALAGFVEVALYTYSPADPVWGFGESVRNACGPVGAFLASGLAGSLGLAAHVLPLAACFVGARYLRGLPVRPRWIPLVAWSVCWVSLAAAFEIGARAFPETFAAHAGGSVGRGLVSGLAAAFHLAGSALVLSISLALSLMIATSISIRDTAGTLRRAARRSGRELGQLVRVNVARLRMRFVEWAEQRRRQRDLLRDTRAEAEEPPLPAGATPRRVLEMRKPALAGDGPEVVRHVVKKSLPQRQEAFAFEDKGPMGPFVLPDLGVLAHGPEGSANFDRDGLIRNSQILEKKLADFNVNGRVVKVHPGPVITMYEFEPAPGVKVSRITNLADDLALALRATAVRIVAPIPGKSVVGIEVPNGERDVVVLREVLSHPCFHEAESKLTIALGKDIFGNPVSADLAAMPHLLVAGATGTGKSVFLNSMLLSILFRARPDEVKLLLIDPKMLEFSLFQGVPHLISEVITNPKRAAAALLGVVHKMEERYALMAQHSVRNIAEYNRKIAKEIAAAKPDDDAEIVPKLLPYIVVVIDELADLMMVAARDVEDSIMRLAQMARAAGIHLVLATQRPSVDVITGVIKANFPTRISFQVSSKADSRTVLDSNGAERLLGMGDMLFVPPGVSKLERIHGPFVSDKEVQTVTDLLRQQGLPEFDPTLVRLKEESEKKEERSEEFDELFDEAVDIVARHRIASISFIQRKLKIGYNRSARIVEQMEAEGIVGPQEGTKARDIYVRNPDEEA